MHNVNCRTNKSSLKNIAKEFLLPKWIFWGRHRKNKWIFSNVSITIGHQICCSFGYLYPVHACFHFELLHCFPCLRDACCAVVRKYFLHGLIQSCPCVWLDPGGCTPAPISNTASLSCKAARFLNQHWWCWW